MEIGTSVMKSWLGAQQTPLENLRKAYSKEGFDPTTKFYALYNDEVVGFITSGIQIEGTDTIATMEFPLVKNDHPEASKALMDYALSSLKKRGVTKVWSRASPDWGNTEDFTKSYDYEYCLDLWISGRLDASKFQGHIPYNDVLKVDYEKDVDKILGILTKFRGLSDQAAKDQLNLLQNIQQRVISWKKLEAESKIIGYDHLVQDKFDMNKSRMNAIYSIGPNPEEIRDKIMSAHVDAAKSRNIQFIDSFFWDATLDYADDYKKYGFYLSPVSRFEKLL